MLSYRGFLLLIAFTIIISGCSTGIIRDNGENLVLKIPGKNWAMFLDIPDLVYFSKFQYLEESAYAYIQAVSRPDWAVFIRFGSANDIKYDLNSTIKIYMLGPEVRLKREEVRIVPNSYIQGLSGDIAEGEYFIEQVSGVEVNMRRKVIYFFHDNVSCEIQISKLNYTTADKESFNKVLNSIKIIYD